MPRAPCNSSTSRQSRRAKSPYTRVAVPDDINDLAAVFGPGTDLAYEGKQTLVVDDIFYYGSLTVTRSGQDHRYVTADDLFRTNGDAHDFLACLALEDHAIFLLETAATECALADAAPAPAGDERDGPAAARRCFVARFGAALYRVLRAIAERAAGKLRLLWRAIWNGVKQMASMSPAQIDALLLLLRDVREREVLARRGGRIAWPHVREILVGRDLVPEVAMGEDLFRALGLIDVQARVGDLAAWVAEAVAERAIGVPV